MGGNVLRYAAVKQPAEGVPGRGRRRQTIVLAEDVTADDGTVYKAGEYEFAVTAATGASSTGRTRSRPPLV
jgi:hypothetical protein